MPNRTDSPITKTVYRGRRSYYSFALLADATGTPSSCLESRCFLQAGRTMAFRKERKSRTRRSDRNPKDDRRSYTLALVSLPTIGLLGSAADAKPPLPTPCISGSCGANAQGFVTYGTAGATVSGSTLTVNQSTSKAILNWADFNIANGYQVNFVQPSSTAAVLNKIWSADPSVIAGALKANGQVYLYNQNGIVFDHGAQIDVGGLVASTLALSTVSSDPDALFKNGLLSNNAAGTQFNSLPAVFQGGTASDGVTPTAGAVTVNAGATLNAAEGGRIMLLGTAVTNQGTIKTPGGQAILAAGNTVYLAASTDPSLRGLLIEVKAGGTVENQGQISADRGNVTLAGMVVNQEGAISATTSVGANGSVYLVAGDVSNAQSAGFINGNAPGFGNLMPTEGGSVTLAEGSSITINADSSDTSTITNQNLANGNFIPSQVALVGQTVTMKSGSTVRAPGATVSLSAATDPYQQLDNPTISQAYGGRIYLEGGSTIDVSGLKSVPVAATRNLVQVTLEGNDLQDDPLLRDGFLHGTKVWVDATRGSTLFDVTPYTGNISLGINEVLTGAGNIKLNSEGDVIARAGSTLDVSGGSVAFQGGYGPVTTKLLGANGKTYDISTAPVNVQYVGLASSYSYTDPTWGTQTNSSAQAYYQGYTQGKSAGSITVLGPQMYLQGSMLATTVAGIYQRSPSLLPLGGQLAIGCACTNGGGQQDYRAPGITFGEAAPDVLGSNFAYADLSVALPTNLQNVLTLSPSQLTNDGFNQLALFSNGPVKLPAGVAVSLPAMASLTVTTDTSIEIAGNIRAPGGKVNLTTQSLSDGDTSPHNVMLDAGAVIDVSGNWINDSPLLTRVADTTPLVTDGGKVTLSAFGDVVLGNNSRVDVSGGGWVNPLNQISAGLAGSINLTASLQASPLTPFSGKVTLGSGVQLIGNSLVPNRASGSGVLSISSGSITVGPASAGTPGEILLSPTFFDNRGFTTYNLTGQNDVVIGSIDPTDQSAVVIHPVQENLVFTSNALIQPTGSSLAGFTQLETLPVTQRAPANISFNTSASIAGPGPLPTGSILLSQYASVVTDPGGNIGLTAKSGSGSIDVLGGLIAPAGRITLQLQSPGFVTAPDGLGYFANQEVLLGSSAVLSAPGYAEVDTLDAQGLREGSVLGGGSVTIKAYKGYVVAEPGSVIDVRGAAGVIDVVGPTGPAATTVSGNAGSVDIEAREGLVLQGSLRGQAATLNGATVPGAGAASLTIGLDLFDYPITQYADTNLAGSSATPYPTFARMLTVSDKPASALSTFLQSGVAQVSAGTIAAGGFDAVTLRSYDIIAFDGSVSLAAGARLTLDAPVVSANSNAMVRVNAPYVALGNYYNQADYFEPPAIGPATVNPNITSLLTPTCAASCTGQLTVNAQLIDIRGLSAMTGFASQALNSSGDIRLTGPQNPYHAFNSNNDYSLHSGLNTPGGLDLNAQQVYPTTNTEFAITAGGKVSIGSVSSSGGDSTPAIPLSAGGVLAITAPSITQGGVLRAPLGQISLNAVDTTDPVSGNTVPGSVSLAANSITSVSGGSEIIPFGATLNGQQWTYAPNSQITQVFVAPPAKAINLNGSNISIEKSAAVDLSGGGDLYAYEWIKGPGGSKDVLSATGLYQYAILPTLGSSFAPIDGQYALSSPAIAANQTIYLSGVPGIATGTYALLPARYALLPGAYAVELLKSNSDLPQGAATLQPNGSYLVAGKFGIAGTDELSSRTSTLLIAPSSVVRSQSQYTDSYANSFYSAAATHSNTTAPRLPADAGQLNLDATSNLAINGSLNFQVGSFTSGTDSKGNPITQEGLGGQVSIVAANILVTDSADSATAPTVVPTGALHLDAQSLNNLGTQTLILGATSKTIATGEQLTTSATQSIELDNTATALQAPEIILAAQNQIAIDAGAKISATGATNQSPAGILVSGAAAVLRASTGAAAPLVADRTVSQSTSGQLSIGSGASVKATGSVLLYSTSKTTTQSDSIISAPALQLYSSHVTIGDLPAGSSPSGLVLTQQLLGTLTGLTSLTIGSTSTIDLYSSLNVGGPNSVNTGIQNITLDAAGIEGFGDGSKSLQAGTITLLDSSTNPLAPTGTGTGALTLRAIASQSSGSGQIILGSGNKNLNGFSSVTLSADSSVQGKGKGTLTLSNSDGTKVDLSLQSAILSGTSASDQLITTAGAVSIGGSTAAAAVTGAAPLGGRLSIIGSSIAQNGTIELPAGSLSLHATDGDVTLGANSLTSTSGSSANFVVTNAVASAGRISLQSDTGNVTLAAGATVDVSGATSPDGKVSGDAGTLSVYAPKGQFGFDGATLKGAAATGQAQGSFTLDAGSFPTSGFSTLENMLANSGFAGDLNLRSRTDTAVTIGDNIVARSFTLTADNGGIDVSGNATINTAGAAGRDGGAINLWSQGDLTLEPGAQLISDAGSAGPVGINGSALAMRAGDITLGSAAGLITINGGTPQRPTLISARGGNYSSTDAQDGTAGVDGTVTFRAQRTTDTTGAYTGVSISVPSFANLTINTGKSVIIEGVQRYASNELGAPSNPIDPTHPDPGCGGGGLCDIADQNGTLFLQSQQFVQQSSTNASASWTGSFANLNKVTQLPAQVRPGIEIDATGTSDLVLDNLMNAGTAGVWDLASWNAALGVPVNLTLRAGGNLALNSSLSDGFNNNGNAVANWDFGAPSPTIGSSSYRLTGGADLSSANPLAVIAQPYAGSSPSSFPATGNVIVTPGSDDLHPTVIRTGSGNIDIAAGGDVLLGYSYTPGIAGAPQFTESDPLSAVIYSAGVPAAVLDPNLFVPSKRLGGGLAASYPIDGGSINVGAAGDIRSAPSDQLVSDWLWRRSNENGDGTLLAPKFNPSWWVVFGNFDQGIGAFGGGGLSLTAGHDIDNVSAVVPTTGRLKGAAGTAPQLANPKADGPGLEVDGGGTLSVRAGGDLRSGVFENEWGNTTLTVDGSLNSLATVGQEFPNLAQFSGLDPATPIFPVLLTGDGVFSVQARGDMGIGFAGNASEALSLLKVNPQPAYFYSYNSDSALDLTSVGGNIALYNSLTNLPTGIAPRYQPLSTAPNVYPPTVNVTAMSGDIALHNVGPSSPLTLFPAASGNLELLAHGSISGDVASGSSSQATTSSFAITMSETDPASWAGILRPAGSPSIPTDAALPTTPLHQNDSQPILIVADTGDISSSKLTFPKAANVIAGGNINELNLTGKNLSASDITLVQAGGDILYGTPTDPIKDDPQLNPDGIQLGGPGQLVVLAGGNVNLGDSLGIQTTGNLNDVRLASTGASLVVGAGFGSVSAGGLRQPNYSAFIQRYIAPDASGNAGSYANQLVQYMQQLFPTTNPALPYSSAFTAFNGLTYAQQLPFLARVLIDELSATGLAHNQQGTNYDRGYNAINTLFPTADAAGKALNYRGDIDMFFSQLKTSQGGDVNMLVPGGSVLVGVPNPPEALNNIKGSLTPPVVSAAANLGVLVLAQGSIGGFAAQDFTVNTSRMLTLEGGDIILWASNGNIDAGRGAKSASGAPPPVIQTTQDGYVFVNPINDVQGSGIGQLLTTPGLKPGLVNLIAPKGDVNAGDAGIRVAGNLNIAAVQVIGANNITVGGTATGVPTSEAGALSGALSGANSLGDAGKAAVDQLTQGIGNANNFQQLTESLTPAFIVVKMFCLGVECQAH